MTNQHPFTCAGDDVPDANCAVVAPGDQDPTSRSECPDGVIVTFKMKPVIWVLFCVLFAEKMG